MKETSFKHYNNTHNKLRFRKLIFKCGLEGYGLYWLIREEIHREGHLKADDMDWLAEVAHCKEERIKEIIDIMIELGLFKKTDDGRIYFDEEDQDE